MLICKALHQRIETFIAKKAAKSEKIDIEAEYQRHLNLGKYAEATVVSKQIPIINKQVAKGASPYKFLKQKNNQL